MATQCLFIVGILFVVLWINPLNGEELGLRVNSQDGHHIVAQKNGKLLLNCSVTVTSQEYGPSVVTWFKDGMLISYDNRIQKVNNGSLLFRRVQHKKKKNISDEGEYECHVQNKIGSIIARRVTLEVASIAKTYTTEPQDQDVYEGGVARFECKIKAVPPPLYTWIKDEVQLTANDRYIIINSGILQLLHVNKGDEGHYSCHATSGGLHHLPDVVDNIRWKRSSEAYLRVKSGNQLRPASIVAGPSDTVAQVGQTVVLECLVDGNPKPTVTWKRSDRRNITRAMLHRGTNLKLLELEEHDSGTYICEVSSQNGVTIMERANLIVTSPPVITEKPKSANYPVSHNARFSCGAEGSPKPKVTWYRNGQKITSSDVRHQITDKGQLVVKQSVLGDSGYYQCIAENSGGLATAFARLTLTANEEAPGSPNVTAVARSSTSIEVSWSQASTSQQNCPLLAYSVELKETESGKHIVTNVLMDSQKTFNNLKPFTNYTVSVRAYASLCGASESPRQKTITTLEDAPSKAPLIRLASTTPNTILVSWDPLVKRYRNGLITEYQIYYMKEGDKSIRTEKAQGSATSFLIQGLLPDTVYRVRVLAATTAGYGRMESEDWPWVDYRTPPGGNVPNPPTINVVQVNYTAVNVSWRHDNVERLPLLGFVLTMRKQISNEIVGTHQLPSWRRSLVLNNLENNTFYVVSLVVKNEQGQSSLVEDQFMLSDKPPLLTPMDVVANSTTATKVHLSWKPPNLTTEISFYTIRYYRWERGGRDSAVKMMTSLSNSVTIMDLMPYTVYQFEVRAHTSDGKTSPYSKPVIQRTREDVPSPPVNMSAMMKNGNIIVTWKPPVIPNGNITTYVILYQLKADEAPKGNWQTITINGSSTSWNLHYQEGKYYYLKMLACTGAGPSNSTSTIIVPQKGPGQITSPEGRSSEDQKIGIIIGCLIGIVCIIICIIIILCRNRCFKHSYPNNTQGNHSHGNGHVHHHGNGHATRFSEPTLVDHHQMEQFTPILSENEHCDSKGCGSGNLIVTPNGTRINGFVPFKNGMRNGHIANGRVPAFSGKGEISHPEERTGLIAYMLASSDGSRTSDEGQQRLSIGNDKSSLEDIDRNVECEESPHDSPEVSSSDQDKTGAENVIKGENSDDKPSYPPSLRSLNQHSTSSSPSCPLEVDGNPQPRSEDTSCQQQAMKGSKQPQQNTSVNGSKPQTGNTSLHGGIPQTENTSVNGGKPQTGNTSNSFIPLKRNGHTSNQKTSRPGSINREPSPPPYPGKTRCYANTSPQEICINSHTVDA